MYLRYNVIGMYFYDKVFDMEKMIHEYAALWRGLMHDILIIEIREKAYVHIHHLEISTQEWETSVSHYTGNI